MVNNWFEAPIPPFLYQKRNLVEQLGFTALFAIVFINIYKPFDSEKWLSESSPLVYLLYSVVLVLLGFVVMVISRVVLYHICRRRAISRLRYIFWILAEVFLMAVFFTLLCYFLRDRITIAFNVLHVFRDACINSSLILVLPYSLFILYLAWKDNKQRLTGLQKKTPSDPVPEAPKNRILSFHDEKGELRFSVRLNDIVYLESADNYVIVHYLNKDRMAKFLLRNSLKAMEKSFSGDGLIRCHRSYIVNFEHVKLMRRGSQQVVLELDVSDVDDIPISKTYYQQVTDFFQKGF